jgi:hypothetical protein
MKKFEFRIEHVTGQGDNAPCFVAVTVSVPLWGPFKRRAAYLSGTHRAPRGVFVHKPGTIGLIKAHPSDLEADWVGDWDADKIVWINPKFKPAINFPELARLLFSIKKSLALDKQRRTEAEQAKRELAKARAQVEAIARQADREEEIDDEQSAAEAETTSPHPSADAIGDDAEKYKLWTDAYLTSGEMPEEVPDLHRPVVVAMARVRVAQLAQKLQTP